MADRAGGEEQPGVPKEVFELDKDERWQARLEEARARREIALREKAAGKPQKPRPKPWEIEGSDVEEPPEIDPIIQERGDDKFDFADRLETIREGKDDTAQDVSDDPPKPAERQRAAPDYNPAPTQKTPAARGSAPEPRARPQPSLILPGAPDVAELAERYAATLDSVEDPTPEPVEIVEPAAEQQDATLVPLPQAETQRPQEERRPLTRAERRRGIRPLGMAFALVGLAALPFATEAPPLEKGPTMPVIDGFRFQPALGVTWSLNQRPKATRSGEWLPGAAPAALSFVPLGGSVRLSDSVALPPLPSVPATATLEWTEILPLYVSPPEEVFVPDDAPVDMPQVSGPPSPLPEPPVETGPVGAPVQGGAVSAPPRPPTLEDGEQGSPSLPRTTPGTVVEEDGLRVTILTPSRTERGLAADIASSVQNDGHELVRVQDVDYSISQRNVRYFHAEDRAAAARMAERYDAELRDFTWFRPSPLQGTAELWLAGRAPAGTAGPRDQGATARGQAVGAEDPSRFMSRVFDRLGLGTELPDRLPDGTDLRIVIPLPGGSSEAGN